MQVNLHTEALESCRAVLKEDPENVKALFRAGKVRYTNKRGEVHTASLAVTSYRRNLMEQDCESWWAYFVPHTECWFSENHKTDWYCN